MACHCGRSDPVTCLAVDYAYIPSPTQGVWEIPLPFGLSFPLRAYAMCIIVGIIAACWITEVRLRRRGAPDWVVLDIAVWAVPFGIIGGRIYHLITSPDAYFGAGGDPIAALYIWNGGLGIPGAIALGGAGVWIAIRRLPVSFAMIADAIAPGLPVAQAIGRLGNWFNQELYGGPTSQPWGLEISPQHQSDIPVDYRGFDAYEPTFLYELVWNLGIAGVIWQLDKRFKFGKGRAFAIYVGLYGLGRFWIEGRRIDMAHAFMGLRVNEWMALAMMVGAAIYLLRVHAKQTVLVPDLDGEFHEVEWDSEQAGAGKFGPAEDADTDSASSDTDSPSESAAAQQAADSDDTDGETTSGTSSGNSKA